MPVLYETYKAVEGTESMALNIVLSAILVISICLLTLGIVKGRKTYEHTCWRFSQDEKTAQRRIISFPGGYNIRRGFFCPAKDSSVVPLDSSYGANTNFLQKLLQIHLHLFFLFAHYSSEILYIWHS